MLIITTAELRGVLGTVSANLAFDLILPHVEQATLTHLQPVLGPELLAELEARRSEGDTTPAFLEALAVVRRPLAYYALLEALPFLNVQISNVGMMEANSSGGAPTRQWSYQGVEVATARNAETFLDAAARYFEQHATAWPAWATSEACTVRRGQLLPDAATFGRFVNIQGSRRAFLAFQPFISRAEELYITPVVSAEQLDVLKDRLMGDVITEADRQLLKRILPALAQFAVAEALPELTVNLSGGGLSVLTDSFVVRQRLSSTQEEVQRVADKATELANRYLVQLGQFLQRNADAYPEYSNSDAYLNPDAQPTYELPDNAGKPSFWV